MRSPACLFLLFSLLTVVPALSQEIPKQEVIKVDTNLVSVPAVVTDRSGRYVAGLQASDFSLSQDGALMKIEFFATEEEPIRIAILLDTSLSTIPVLGDIRHAAKDFIKHLRKDDQAMLVTFDHEVKVIRGLSGDTKALDKAVDSIKPAEFSGTVMRDAVNSVITGQFKALKGRKAVVVLTDGRDNGSGISEEDLLDTSTESDTVIYPIFFMSLPAALARNAPPPRMGRLGGRGGMGGMGRGGIMGPRFPRPDKQQRQEIKRQQRRGRIERRFENVIEYLQELAGASSGRFYRADVSDLKKTFGQIADELRHQYRLGFYPPEEKEKGSLHQLTVHANRPDLVVRSRRQYALPRP